jgi:hypothetical protein
VSDPAFPSNGRETFAARFLSAEGRLGRRGFLVSALVLLAVAVVYDINLTFGTQHIKYVLENITTGRGAVALAYQQIAEGYAIFRVDQAGQLFRECSIALLLGGIVEPKIIGSVIRIEAEHIQARCAMMDEAIMMLPVQLDHLIPGLDVRR